MITFILLAFLVPSSAFTTFQPSCTVPNDPVTFVSSPKIRGSLDIIWSCLFTLIACTWTVLHLNVPEQRDGREPGWGGDVKWAWKRLRTNIKWSLFTLMAPEVVVGIALMQLLEAKACLEQIREIDGVTKRDWSLIHAYYVCMGGFVLRVPGPVRAVGTSNATPVTSRETGSSTSILNDIRPASPANGLNNPLCSSCQHEILLTELESGCAQRSSEELPPNHESVAVAAPQDRTRDNSGGEERSFIYHLTGGDFITLMKDGHISKKPPITEEELGDKVKSDAFVKLIAAGQIVWFCIEIIARAVRHIHVSQLELATTAFAGCSVLIYLLNFKKPKGISGATIYQLSTGSDAMAVRSRLLASEMSTRSLVESNFPFLIYFEVLLSWSEHSVRGKPIANDSVDVPLAERYFHIKLYTENWIAFVSVSSAAVIFGAYHVAAWNFAFPNRIDRDLWRYSAIVSTLILPANFVLNVTLASLSSFLDRHANVEIVAYFSFGLLTFVLFTAYIAARGVLIVEMFRCLAGMPPDAFVATWALNLPHIG